MSDDFDPELERIKQIKAARLRLGLDDPAAPEKEPEVTLYSTDSCPYCRMAKGHLQSKGVKFTERKVDRDPAAAQNMVRHTGQRGVPQLDIGGKWIVGFSPGLIDSALAAMRKVG